MFIVAQMSTLINVQYIQTISFNFVHYFVYLTVDYVHLLVYNIIKLKESEVKQ